MMEGEAPGTDRRRIAAVSVGIGFLAGAAVLGVVEALSRCWSAASAYNQGLLGVGITQTFVSVLLVLFFAGFLAVYAGGTASRSARLLSALLAGAVAGFAARTLLFAGNPAYLVQSLVAAPGQVLLLVGGTMLVAGLGGLVASFLDPERPYRDLLPVAAVAVAFLVVPPLLATAGIAAGVIPPAPYSGGEPAPKTDILVLKVSAAGDVEWEARVDIAAYDQPDVLIEYPGGYALAVTEYGREGSTAHILTYGDRGDARDRLAIKAGFGRVTALVPADGGEFLAATERPGIVRVGAGGEVLWERSFAGEDQGMVPVSLLAQGDRYVAAWEDKIACFDDNGTRLWEVSLDGGINYHPIYQAPGGGVLVFVEGQSASAGGDVETCPQAVRLDGNGTVLWTRDFGSGGFNELLGVRETAPGEFAVLYRSVTHSGNFWGGTERVSHGHLATLNDDGEVTGHHAIEGSGGAVIPAENGYLSVTAAGTGVTLVGRDVTGSEVWRQEQPFDLYSFRGIGTADGGYLIAGSVAA
ncbi:PQQ-binding-like beta-propeller repeat protein [Methanoculleus chikugoensis]|uniref:Pyrrolo-quinoline quinone repeat domain-containing protein n=1 Tax=Methanoculleus chikugoensis TaxID=118126 RepID=A0ABN5XJ63_9EURY|nr:PQQ-binding-like beta-propeller repeat protein [Methanoculleus chikugoensis]BBL68791.1 hypothetical protein MchiMG62_19720 [Methanoculleus chikugoensis]